MDGQSVVLRPLSVNSGSHVSFAPSSMPRRMRRFFPKSRRLRIRLGFAFCSVEEAEANVKDADLATGKTLILERDLFPGRI